MEEVLWGAEYVIPHNRSLCGGRIAGGGQVTGRVPSDDLACDKSDSVMDSIEAPANGGIDRRKGKQEITRRIICRMEKIDELETRRLRGSHGRGCGRSGRAEIVWHPPSEWRSSKMDRRWGVRWFGHGRKS